MHLINHHHFRAQAKMAKHPVFRLKGPKQYLINSSNNKSGKNALFSTRHPLRRHHHTFATGRRIDSAQPQLVVLINEAGARMGEVHGCELASTRSCACPCKGARKQSVRRRHGGGSEHEPPCPATFGKDFCRDKCRLSFTVARRRFEDEQGRALRAASGFGSGQLGGPYATLRAPHETFAKQGLQ